jgi:hypothetical protein
MSGQNRTCKGLCKRFQVTKPSGFGRYESGQAHCQTCNTWVDHNSCRLRDGSNATKGSIGWFCKCCNIQVRQHPRNKAYKEKLRNVQKQNSIEEIDPDDDPDLDEIRIEHVYISKNLAQLLKKITVFMPDVYEQKNLPDIKVRIPKSIRSEIIHNWGNLDGFVETASNYDNITKISAIILFEKLKNQIGKIPTKEEFFQFANVNDVFMDNEFKSWEHFLELLQYDPWYRNSFKDTPLEHKNPILNEENETCHDLSGSYFGEQISDDEILEKIGDLRKQIEKRCKEYDSLANVVEYSHEEMFHLLEKYLRLLPKSFGCTNVRDFL